MRRTRTEAEISKVVGKMWQNEPEDTKDMYYRLAEHAKEKHLEKPSLKYKTPFLYLNDDSDYVLPEEEEDSDYVASDDEDQNPSPLLTSSQFKCFAESLIHSWIIDLNDREAEAQFTVEEWKEIRCEIRKLPEIVESFVDSMMRFADKSCV
ncbi:unnamed protein product [Rhizophagus irregularis]|nr:unnamed protein product [Rhizophagus irregularis]CAB5197544.1 unnamed protein product [Rhizophagus irregularis]